ncbi:MAG: sulfite exporter TauE/SafE family protein [Acutalibacteraceae bacterium]
MGKEHENDIKIHLNVEGMSCPNCEVRIKNMLDSTDGIYCSQVSYRTGKVEIIFDSDKISLEDIKKKIEDLGYSVCEFENNKKGAFRASLIKIGIILLLFAVLQYFGILNYLVPSQLADSGMGYSMLFVIGLITSVHCIAMCGGINLSQSLPADAKNASRKRALLPSLFYNFGRVISYTVIGFVLGLIGMIIGGKTGSGVSYMLQGILKIIAGIFMVIMGINMLGIFPKLRKISFQMPASFSRKVNRAGRRSKTPLVVGLLNGLMPCGPLQSMQIIALASANPLTGALSMLVFSLGTVPLMLGLGSVVSLLGHKFSDKVMTVGSVLVAVLGLSMLSQGRSPGPATPTGWRLCLKMWAGLAGRRCPWSTQGISPF